MTSTTFHSAGAHRVGSVGSRIMMLVILSLSLVSATELMAIGPLSAFGLQGTIYASNRFPLVYQTDQGSLGQFNNTAATTIATYAFGEWQKITTATVSFLNSGQLDHDVTSATDPLISGPTQYSDGVFPVVYDNNGSIINAQIGAGAAAQVFGYAASFSDDGVNFQEGLVVLNGALSSRENADEIYREVATHEIGHMLGLSHSQLGLRSNFALMYPTTLSAVSNLGIDADDRASVSLLYPAAGYLASVGTLKGKILSNSDAPLSGINVVAVNATTGDAFTTVSDYYGGDDPLFRSKPARNGSYEFRGLPPGQYYVRIEPMKSFFTEGSRVSSYLTPINTDLHPEWYNGANENGDLLRDDGNEKTAVTVTAGGTTSGIDFVANDSPTISTVSEHNGSIGQRLPIPLQLSNASISKLAVRYTTPVNGSLLAIRIFIGDEALLSAGGSLKVTIYENTQGSLAGVPGTVLGSMSIPLADLEADQENEIWLRGIGDPVNFFQGEIFHVGLEIEGTGTIDCFLDDAAGTKNQTSYFIPEAGRWQNFPDGLTGAAGWNLRMSAIFTTVPAGVPTPILGLSPESIAFGTNRVGTKVTKPLEIRNYGTANLNITGLVVTGAGAGDFAIEKGSGSHTILPGKADTILVSYTASSTSIATASIVITHNAAGTLASVALSGKGKRAVVSGLLTLIDLGQKEIGTTTETNVAAFTNTGSDSMYVTGLTLTGSDANSGVTIRSFAGPSWVAPGGKLNVRLAFKPTEVRSYSATLVIGNELGQTLTIPVVGTALAVDTAGSVSSIRSGRMSLRLLGARPNPVRSNGDVYWESEGSGTIDLQVQILDVAGRVLQTSDERVNGTGGTGTGRLHLDFSRLAAGIYYVAAGNGGEKMMVKVVVEK